LASGATAKYPNGSFSGNTLVSYNAIVSMPDNANQSTTDTILVNTSVTLTATYVWYNSLVLNGLIRDGTTAGQVIKGIGGDTLARAWVKLGCATNSYSGGTDVQRGPMEILAAGALSTGNVTVNSGGRLKTSAANSLASVTHAGHTVSVNANGTLELNATETNPYIVQTGGALMADAAGLSSTFTYGTGGNIQLAKGAILDISVATKPSYAVVSGQLQPGDGRFGLYEGHNGPYGSGALGIYTTTRFFGDDGSANIWRGLALLNCGSAMTNANTMAANAGTAYLDFYAQQDATLTFQGASLLANTVLLNGNGTFVFQNGCGTSTYNNISFNGGSLGIGGLKIASNGDVCAGATMNVSNGWFAVGQTNTLAGLTLNVGSGGVFSVTPNLMAGTVHVASGGALFGATNQSAGASWIIDAGTQIGIGVGRSGGSPGITGLPTNGVADFVGWGDYYNGNSGALPLNLNCSLALGNGTRYTPGPYNDGYYVVNNLKVTGTGVVQLATGSTQCRLCSSGGTTNTMTLPVTLNAGAGKLIVGDTNLFNALLVGGVSGYMPITQNGTVYLTNPTNQIGNVDIQAGMLEVSSLAALGGTSAAAAGGGRAIAISNGASLWLNYAGPVLSNATLTGSGSIALDMTTDTLTLTNAAGANGAIQPGMAGPLSVQGNLAFAKSATTQTLFTVNIGKTGGVVTNGLLAVSGNVTNLNNAALYVSFDPKMHASDVAGKVFTILTCANDLTAAPHFNSVTWTSPAKGGTVVYTAGAVRLTTVNIPASGTTIFVQ